MKPETLVSPQILSLFPKSPFKLTTSLHLHQHLANSSCLDLIWNYNSDPNWLSNLRLALIQFILQATTRESLWVGNLILSFHYLELFIGSFFMFMVKCHLLN